MSTIILPNHCCVFFRVTILCNKFDGHPKGFAYVEFTDKDSVQTAMALDDSLFRGRQIKVLDVLLSEFCLMMIMFQVMPKRTNKPGITTTNRPPRGRGFRGGRGARSRGYGGGYMRRPRGGYRGRGYYSPYWGTHPQWKFQNIMIHFPFLPFSYQYVVYDFFNFD